MRHDITFNHTAGDATTMFYGNAAEYRHHVRGPATIVNAPPSLFRLALIAASVWNQYLPTVEPKYFNISAKSLPGNIVGQIWIPCPQNVCNVTIDPSYESPLNVLIHELGHGIGLPPAATSGIGSYVDSGNHWHPPEVDPREIMTAYLDASPYLALYTLRAMAPHQHLGCLETHQCPSGLICYPTSLYDSPGVCDLPGSTIVNPWHYPTYGVTGVWVALTFGLFLFVGLMIALAAASAPPAAPLL